MTIGEDIKKYRKNEGMTQEEMTVRLGVNKWEKGGASYMRTMYSRAAGEAITANIRTASLS